MAVGLKDVLADSDQTLCQLHGGSPCLSPSSQAILFPVVQTSVLAATCGTELGHIVLAVGHNTGLLAQTGVLTALCGSKFDHGVLAVGYGTESDTDCWMVRFCGVCCHAWRYTSIMENRARLPEFYHALT